MRQASLNKKLALAAMAFAEAKGADARFIDLPAYDLPLYNDDIITATGMPAAVEKLKAEFMAAHGVFIASPEYNGAYTGALKNAFDWISRKSLAEEQGMAAFAGKPFALVSASTGGHGGLRGLIALRDLLGKMRAHVFADQLAVGGAQNMFDDASGALTDAGTQDKIRRLTTDFIEFATRLKRA